MTSAASTVGRVAQVKVESLRCSDENPRAIRPERMEQLKRALVADPEMLRARPLIALPDGTVVAGNMRLLAARELGWATIPCVTADLDPERARLWMLRDNQGYGEWEEEGLAALLAELEADGADMALAGFEHSELERLLTVGLREGRTDPDEAPPLPIGEPRSKVGEVYELGPHRLMCGDATNAAHVASLMRGESAVLLATDPPYGVDYANVVGGRKNQKVGGWRDIAGDALTDEPLLALVRDALALSDARTLFLWHAAKRSSLFIRAIEETGWEIAQQIIWVKNALVFGGSDYQWRHEPCFYARRKGSYCDATRTWTTVWEFPKEHQPVHPTQKPVALFEIPMERHTKPGDICYEPFCGSGSQVIAAEQSGRRCFAMEIDPAYCDVIRQRYEDFVGG